VAHVFLEMTMTLDGFTAAPGVSLEHPFGLDGERVRDWVGGVQGPTDVDGLGTEGAADASPDEIDRNVAARMFETTGAFVIGRRTFDVGEAQWGDDPVFEGRPVFVVTTRERESFVRGGSRFQFVRGGIADAVARASEAASAASDEARLHLVPVLLGGGSRLFPDASPRRVELEPLGVEQGARATHLRYRVVPPIVA
jgi:dihydrofolate reductase